METSRIWRLHCFTEGFLSSVLIGVVTIQCLIGDLLSYLLVLDSPSWTIYLIHQLTLKNVSHNQFWSWWNFQTSSITPTHKTHTAAHT